MDTSKEYILMCEKAGEIQKLWEYRKRGDFCVFKNTNNLWVIGCSNQFKNPVSENYSWLPRQDQLQEMVLKNNTKVYSLGQFTKWVLEDICCNNMEANKWSMEQLWLAFVMKEKYNKVWNGKEWE